MIRIIFLVLVLSAPSALFAQYASTYPAALLPYENSVCRVTVQDAGGTKSHGSGLLIQPPSSHAGKNYVLTAYHVIRDRSLSIQQPVSVTWNGEDYFTTTVCAARPQNDAAILELVHVPQHLLKVPLAAGDILPGEQAYLFGFGTTEENRLRCSGGPTIDYTSNSQGDPCWFTFTGHARDGDSGGPVFVVRNGRPYVVGCGWGTRFNSDRNHYVIAATRLCIVRRIFGLETSPILRRIPRRSTNTQTMIYSGSS